MIHRSNKLEDSKKKGRAKRRARNIVIPAVQIREPVEKMAEIAIHSGLARYSCVDGEAGCGGLPSLAPMLVIEETHEHEKELVSVIKALSSSLAKVKKDTAEDAKVLFELGSFKDLATDHVLLLHQFVSKRDDFLSFHTFCDSKETIRIMGIHVNNLSRKMQQMRENGEILFVKMGDSYLYPEFQFDCQGNVYRALSHALPVLYSAGRSGWDICFWLFTKQSTLLKRGLNPTKLKGLSFDDLLKNGKQFKKQAVYHKGTPIETLRSDNNDVFTAQLEDWVAPDNRELSVRI